MVHNESATGNRRRRRGTERRLWGGAQRTRDKRRCQYTLSPSPNERHDPACAMHPAGLIPDTACSSCLP
jgi:hypothetical protein